MNSTITIHALKVSDEDFERIVQANPEWNFEQTAAIANSYEFLEGDFVKLASRR